MPKKKALKVEQEIKRGAFKVTLFTNGQFFPAEGENVLDALKSIHLTPDQIGGKTYIVAQVGGREKSIFIRPILLRQLFHPTNTTLAQVFAKRLTLLTT